MRRLQRRGRARVNSGFTLVEAAVTIAIVGIVLLAVMQGLEGAKMAAFYTKLQKTAYELGRGLLGEIHVGLYREELESGMSGDFSEQEEPRFRWEVTLGDDVFEETTDEGGERPFDNYADRRDREEEQEDSRDTRFDDEDEDEEATEPFEKVRVRVTFPAVREYPSELVLERWIPWAEVYGEDEEDELEGQSVGGPVGENGGGQAPGGQGGR